VTTAAPSAPTAAAPPDVRRPRAGKLAGARAVFERDFLVFTSRPRFLLLRTLMVVVPSILLLGAISTSTLTGTTMLGPIIFGSCAVLLPALVMLLAPVVAASCIAAERALGTLPVVLATPVSPFGFAAAKLLSRLGVVLVLVFATLPLAGICFLYGGVSAGLFVEFAAFLAALAIFGVAAGVVASAWARSVGAAALLSYFLAIALPALHHAGAYAWAAMHGDRSGRSGPLMSASISFQWSQMIQCVFAGRTLGTHPGWTLLAWSLLAAAVALAVATWRVAREAAGEVAAAGGSRRAGALKWNDPVLDRAVRGSLLHRPGWSAWLRLGFLVLIDAIVVVAAVAGNDLHKPGPHVAFLLIVTFLVALFAMTAGAQSIAGERETGALDMLLATRLTPSEVVRGKFLGVLLSVAPLVAFALLHAAIAVVATRLTAPTALAWIAGLVVITVFSAAFGLWCSAGASTTTRSILLAYGLLIGGAVFHAVTGSVAMVVLARNSTDLIPYVWGPSPFWVGIAGAVVVETNEWSSMQYHTFISWLLWSAAYVAAAVGLLGWTRRRLERRHESS
jgi:ABC-type transport system involved in multi-copper enzyme maturation permease subunit